MTTRVFATIGMLTLTSCGDGSADVNGLRESFAEQITSVGTVSNFGRDGDELTFSGPDGAGGQSAWLVHIDSVVIEPQDDENLPYRGLIQSSWYADGQLVQPTGAVSHLPSEFLESGIAQDCWGLWDATENRWTW